MQGAGGQATGGAFWFMVSFSVYYEFTNSGATYPHTLIIRTAKDILYYIHIATAQ